MTSLIHLIYASTATPPVAPSDLAAMLRAAREKNARLGVTGLLLHLDGSFFQVLEGDEAHVDGLFTTIAGDPRHADVVTIIREPIARRDFGGWTMALPELSDAELATLPGLDEGHRRIPELDPGRAKRLLDAFVNGRWRRSLGPAKAVG